MKIILIGLQGSGKSTQGNLLSEKLGLPYLSSGHIFRAMAQEKTDLGRYVKELLSGGLLIPDDITFDVVSEYLTKPEYQNGYILDGFPRTIVQAKKFKEKIDYVFYLKLTDEKAIVLRGPVCFCRKLLLN
jgi:adenylate kinase